MTVNIPESYLESVAKLVGEGGFYPSRSELIRVAVRDFLIKELKRANEMIKYKEVEVEELDDEKYVRVPTEKMDEKEEPIREFKTYKIIKRLEYGNTSEKQEVSEIYNLSKIIDFQKGDCDEFGGYDELEKLKPSINELRGQSPSLPDFKFINEW